MAPYMVRINAASETHVRGASTRDNQIESSSLFTFLHFSSETCAVHTRDRKTRKTRKTETKKLAKRNTTDEAVANSEAIRLPTLRELIGYPTYYDGLLRTVTTLSSASFLHPLRDDVDNDISQGHVDESIRETNNEPRDIEKDLARSPRDRVREEIDDDSWLRQVSDSEVKPRLPHGKRVTLEGQTLVTNSIQEDDGGEQEKPSTRIYLRPTTMRGIPLAKLTPSSQMVAMRGFYVTKSENDSPISIPANGHFTTPRVTTYRDRSITQQTEITLIPGVSTTDHIATVTSQGSGQYETVLRPGIITVPPMPNNGASSIVSDELPNVNNLERDSFISSSSVLSSEDSADSAENLSDWSDRSETGATGVTTLARPAPKRGKLLRFAFDHDTASVRDARVISSSTTTTPTRRKIALAVNRYNEATVPLWTGRRIVVRKRNRNTLSPIKKAIKRTEDDFIRTTADVFRNVSLSTVVTSASTARKSAITSESTVAFEAANVHGDFANFTADTATEDLEKRATTEATSTSVTDATTAFPSFTKLPTATLANDATTALASTPADSITIVTMPVIANASIITSAVALAETRARLKTTETTVITTTTSAAASARTETASEIANYSAITILAITARTDSVANEYAITTAVPAAANLIEADTVDTAPAIANYPMVTVNPSELATDSAAIETTSAADVEITYTASNYTPYTLFHRAIPSTTDTHATVTIPTALPLMATVTSITDMRTNTLAPTTTRDPVNANTDVTIDTSTITRITTVTDPTSTDPNALVISNASANANVSHAITPAITADTTAVTTVTTRFNSAMSEQAPVTSTDSAALASLAIPDEISSTVSPTARLPSTILDLSVLPDVDGEDLDGSAATVHLSIGSTRQLTTTFETTPALARSTTTTSRSLPNIDFETPTVVTADVPTIPIQLDGSNLTTSTDARTSSSVFSTTGPTIDTATYHSPTIATDATGPSITSGLESAQMMDKNATLSETNVERGDFEEASKSIARDQTESTQKSTNIDRTNSLQTANKARTTPNIETTSDETASKSVQSPAGNRSTSSNLGTDDYALGQKTPRRRVLNRTNNWIGSPVARQSIDRYPRPRSRVTVYRRIGGGRARSRPSFDISSSAARPIEGNHRRRIVQKRLGTSPEAIGSTAGPENTSVERIVRDPAKDGGTREMKVASNRITEKEITKGDTAVLPVQETTVPVESFVYTPENKTLQTRDENGNVGSGRQVVPAKGSSSPRSGEGPSGGANASANSEPAASQPLSSRPRGTPERTKTRRRLRIVSKVVRRMKSENKNITVQGSVDSDRINKSLQNDLSNEFYTSDNLFDEGNARDTIRLASKSARLESEKRNVAIEEANTNFRLRSTGARLMTQDDTPPSFRTSGNPEGVEGKTRRIIRIVSKRVKSKSQEGETITERANATTTDTANESLPSITLSNRREKEENPSLRYKTRGKNERTTKVVLTRVRSKSKINSTEETSEHLLDKIGAKEGQMDIALDRVKPKLVEKDSMAEETNADFDFAVKESRVAFPFDSSNNLRVNEKTVRDNFSSNVRVDDDLSNIEQTQKGAGFNYKNEETTIEQGSEPHAESVARVEEDTDRLSLEANSSKNDDSVKSKTGNGYPNSNRKAAQSTRTLILPINAPPNTHRRGTPIETTVSPKIEFIDAFESTELYAKQTATEDDQRTDVSDQSIRAQEFAVTVADPPFSSDTGRTPLRDAVRRKISTTVQPRTNPTIGRTISRYDTDSRNHQRSRTKNRPTVNTTTRPRRPPVIDYDYYEDEVPIVVGKSALNSKLFLTSKGTIRCLDQGNFPHPYSCKKFITCARMVNGQVIGTEYTCPDKLSFDPVGGICNWSAGLGCKD